MLDQGDIQIAELANVETNLFLVTQLIHIIDIQMIRPHSMGSSSMKWLAWEGCKECRQLVNRVLPKIHQEEHLYGGQVHMLVDEEPQIWVRKQNDNKGRSTMLLKVFESIRQAIKGMYDQREE